MMRTQRESQQRPNVVQKMGDDKRRAILMKWLSGRQSGNCGGAERLISREQMDDKRRVGDGGTVDGRFNPAGELPMHHHVAGLQPSPAWRMSLPAAVRCDAVMPHPCCCGGCVEARTAAVGDQSKTDDTLVSWPAA